MCKIWKMVWDCASVNFVSQEVKKCVHIAKLYTDNYRKVNIAIVWQTTYIPSDYTFVL